VGPAASAAVESPPAVAPSRDESATAQTVVKKKLGTYPLSEEPGGTKSGGAADESVTRSAQLKNARAEAQSLQELGGGG